VIDNNSNAYCTVKQLAEDPYFCFTVSMLRYYILEAHKNGLAKAIRRIGRKVLIRRDLFVQWIEEQGARKSK
jgi:hypothetical protein